MKPQIQTTSLQDLLLIDIPTFEDERGHFRELFHQQKWSQLIGIDFHCLQINQSYSHQHVLRGLHFQAPPYAQHKLVEVIKGEILDIAVDLREASSSYAKHLLIKLSEASSQAVFIPKGFAHGFLVLSTEAIVQYSIDVPYVPAAERGIHYQDPELQIGWPEASPPFLLSAKDQQLGSFSDTKGFF